MKSRIIELTTLVFNVNFAFRRMFNEKQNKSNLCWICVRKLYDIIRIRSLHHHSNVNGFSQEDFGIDETYPEGQVIKMGKKAMQILSLKDEEFYEGCGIYFVELVT